VDRLIYLPSAEILHQKMLPHPISMSYLGLGDDAKSNIEKELLDCSCV